VPPLVVTAADLDGLDAALPEILETARSAAQEAPP
jgi:acetylornithine/N-succinyldiaminopimelate aminotransferase